VRLHLPALEAAKRVRRLVTEKMAQAIRLHVTELGEDPRDYLLMAFGGAAPLHAYDIARNLGIERVRFSSRAGVFAAFGLLTAPAGLELVQTLISPLQRLSGNTLEASARELRERALTTLRSTGLAEDEIEIRFERTVIGATQASIDALTRAIAWTEDESEVEAALLRAKAELLIARTHLSRPDR